MLESGDAPLSLLPRESRHRRQRTGPRSVSAFGDTRRGQTAAWWIAIWGSLTDPTGGDPVAQADFSVPASAPPVPWAVQQPGFRVERVATDFQLPVNLAFIPNPGPGPDAPLFYVSELYGTIKVVTRAGQVSDYATNLLNFNPTGAFPGSGEMGLTGIAVDPGTGDVFASMVYEIPPRIDVHSPKVVRFHSSWRFSRPRARPRSWFPEVHGGLHKISNLSLGTDGKLYCTWERVCSARTPDPIGAGQVFGASDRAAPRIIPLPRPTASAANRVRVGPAQSLRGTGARRRFAWEARRPSVDG